MRRYIHLLNRVDRWFGRLRERHPDNMQCGRGCALCCYGLFDISLPDAILVATGLSRLSPDVRQQVRARAAPIQTHIVTSAPELQAPYLLQNVTEERIDTIVDTAGAPRCPFLGQHNECLIYEHRPLPCRLEGTPMIDRCDGLFGDWCELNFRDGVPETALNDLRLDYYGIQNTERIVTESLSEDFLQKRQSDVTVFIPSVIVEFESFWSTRLL